jgi:hypothetical protein
VETKICPSCKVSRGLDSYTPSTTSKDGYHCYCKECRAEKQRERYSRQKEINPNYVSERREWLRTYIAKNRLDPVWVERYREKYKNYAYKKKYKMSLLDKETMLNNQGSSCLMCEKKMELDRNCHVDHNHNTGVVRGLLCGSCNTGLHFVENKTFLANAQRYLLKYDLPMEALDG